MPQHYFALGRSYRSSGPDERAVIWSVPLQAIPCTRNTEAVGQVVPAVFFPGRALDASVIIEPIVLN
jgi:hypothetical protein